MLWLVLAGWWLALTHIVTGIALCITIIGIPFGIANFTLIPVSLLPLGREIVRTDEPFAATDVARHRSTCGPVGGRGGFRPHPVRATVFSTTRRLSTGRPDCQWRLAS